MMLSLLLDGLIIALLLITLMLGARLHRTLRRLRTSGNEFDQLIAALDESTERAQSALSGLKQTADDSGKRLEEKAAEVQRLLDDLGFMVQRGDQTADRLEQAIGKARGVDAVLLQETVPAPPQARAASSLQAGLEHVLKTLR